MLERFRDDPECRVFLSTDAGGTGLNLQSGDTVINLEVPWNPAVLEQRIARVHRMGQHRPVQVFNLVMRDSVEERVLRTAGTETLAVRRIVQRQQRRDRLRHDGPAGVPGGGARPVRASDRAAGRACRVRAAPAEAAPVRDGNGVESGQALLQAGVQFLEALATAMTGPEAR